MSSTVSPISSLSAYSGNYFNGLSNYAQDLNNAISRQLQIAGLPIQLLQNNVNTLNSQSNELQTLSTQFTSVQSAISALADAAGNTLEATVADPSVATATLTSGALPASYSLQVSNLGSYSDALSTDNLPKVTNPATQTISTSSSFTLTVNQNTIQPPITSDGTLNGLVAAINSAGAGVQATVVNVGSDSQPDYRLSLQGDEYGNVSMQLSDGGQDLLSASGPPGQSVQYSINGHSVTSGTRTVTLAPGVTVNLTSTNPDGATTIAVAQSASGIGNALASFVSAYNVAMAELNKNRGQGTGALAGQSIVYELTNALQGIPNYSTGAGNIASLAAVGLKFNDTTGTLSFDQDVFNSATGDQMDALTQFLGSATGGGFLESATNVINGFLDPTTGVLTADINTVQSGITSTNAQITAEQNQVTQLQTNLTQQMSAADATIYELQQQASQMQNMFIAMQDSQLASAYGG